MSQTQKLPSKNKSNLPPDNPPSISPPDKCTWWEKTIEYHFVSTHASKYQFSMPLAANHEKLGDTAFSQYSKWIAVEFKKGFQGDVICGFKKMEKSEIVKFHGDTPDARKSAYKAAQQKLCGNYDSTNEGINHHFMVYGQLSDSRILQLKAYRYFSSPEEGAVPVEDVFSMGIGTERFFEYINDFIKGKLGLGEDDPISPSGGPGGLEGPDFGVVIGIATGKDGNYFTAMKMSDFIAYRYTEESKTPASLESTIRNVIEQDGFDVKEVVVSFEEGGKSSKKRAQKGWSISKRIDKFETVVTKGSGEQFGKPDSEGKTFNNEN